MAAAFLAIPAQGQVTAGGAQFAPYHFVGDNYGTVYEGITSMAPIKDIVAADGFLALRSDGTFIQFRTGVDTGVVTGHAVKIAAAGTHFLALTPDGKVLDWGYNHQIPPLLAKPVANIAGSYQTSGVIYKDGTVQVWGQDVPSKKKVPANLNNVTQLALSDNHGLALKSDGTLTTWGDEAQTIPPDLKEVVQIGAGNGYSVVLQANGKLVAWGEYPPVIPPNLSGVVKFAFAGSSPIGLAIRSDGSVVNVGVNGQLRKLDPPTDLGPCIAATPAFAGNQGSAVRTDGSVVVWSDNGSQFDIYAPPGDVSGLVKISGGNFRNFVAGLQFDGGVRCWGNNAYGQCNVPPGLVAKDVQCGYGFVAALKTDGTVVCWGQNSAGQCNVPTGLSGVVSISVGRNHTLALKSDGTVVAWGASDATNKTKVPPGLTGVKQVAAGDYHSVALKTDGALVVWPLEDSTRPPDGLTDISSITAGRLITVAIKNDGTVVSWGSNASAAPPVLPGKQKYQQVALVESGGIGRYRLPDGIDRVRIWNFRSYDEGNLPIYDYAGWVTPLGTIPTAGVTIRGAFIPAGGTGYGIVVMPTPPGTGGANIDMTCDNPAITIPSHVFIPAGSRFVKFPIVGGNVSSPVTCTITVGLTKASVTVTPLPALAALKLNRDFVGSGSIAPVVGYVALSAPTVTNRVVTLQSSSPHLVVPRTVRVGPGFDAASFAVKHVNVTAKETVTVTATYDGVTRTFSIELRPLVVTSLVLQNSNLASLSGTTATVTLTSITDFDRVVNLTTTHSGLVTIPASVVVPAGSTVATFLVTVKKVTATTTFVVTATYNLTTKKATGTLIPAT